ncbi:histidinol-phosphate transaminase [Microaerobacter geothermalis]|uniref:histidinol-phosphate transaminase n=1 Tax=Microaerobacter geothermalis TaxID=674972 RepID=UPI001F35CDDC|nr:histidinol-phosphate transaminase [Microaerobacter geothermalis]MCF6093374.1 histidinol-phosphate transaminase [Microaerobacter geothermalis]
MLKPKERIVNLPVYQPGKPIEDVKREYGLSEVIKLASNENPFGCSPLAKEAIGLAAQHLEIYPDGASVELTKALAKKLGVQTSQIIFGNGSDEVIVLITRAYLQPGTNTVMATPTFPIYKTNSIIEGAEVREVPLKDGAHDLNGMLEQIDENTRVVWICNPNNPSGTIVGKEELRTFLHAISKNTVVVFDEAYYEYVESSNYPESIDWINEYPNLIILRTFSKIYGLAALRIGYGVANAALIDHLNRVREPFNTTSLSQKAALAALQDTHFVEECRHKNTIGKKQLYEGFQRLGLSYLPSEANFILVDVGRPAGYVFQSLLKKGIIVRSGESLGFPTSLRITVGSEDQNLKLLDNLEQILNQ